MTSGPSAPCSQRSLLAEKRAKSRIMHMDIRDTVIVIFSFFYSFDKT